MPFSQQVPDLRAFIAALEATGNLVHFTEEVSTRHEIPAAMRYIARRLGKAVVFDRVKGYDVPVAGNLYLSRRHLAIAFGVRDDEVEEAYLSRAESPVKPAIVSSGPVQEVMVKKDVDILRYVPVLTYHEKDVGPYLTSAVAVARDPETGIRGMGVHRVEIKGKDKFGIFLGTPPLSAFLAKAEAAGKPLDIAIVLGVGPLVFCASVFSAPKGVDKFDIAGGFTRAPVELVKCCSVDLEVPANAEFVLEGHVLPRVREKEGPFGESTGYYFTFDNPVGRIVAITHRCRPMFDGLVPFAGEGETMVQIMTRPFLLKELRSAVPDVSTVDLRTVGIGGLCVVQISKKTEDDARKIIDQLLGSAHIKLVAVVDEDVSISDLNEIIWAISTRVRPAEDLVIKSGLPGLSIDPSIGKLETAELGRVIGPTSKLGIDATKPLKELATYERIGMPAEVEKKIRAMMEVIR